MSQKITRIGKFHFWWGLSMVCIFPILGSLMIGHDGLRGTVSGSVLLILSLLIAIVIFSKKNVTHVFSTSGEKR